jgi:hypothetical protein
MLIQKGSCVRIPDKRVGRVREKINGKWKIRVRRKTSMSHEFLYFKPSELKSIPCPKGWMSIQGYNDYIRKSNITLGMKK